MRLIKLMIIAVFASSIFTFSSQARDTIKIVGSSTVYPYATVVAERFGKTGFSTPVIESTGTGGGMKLFCAGVGTDHPDITNASRKIKSKEKALCAKNGVTDIIEITIGNDGLTLAHSLDAADADFTQEHLFLAIAEKVPANLAKDSGGNVIAGNLIDNPYEKWSDIDASLPDHKIEILVAPPTSGTRDAWNSLIMKKGCKAAGAYTLWENAGEKAKKKCAVVREDGRVIEAGENDTLIVQKLSEDPERFGYFGYSYLLANEDKIKSAAITGIQPSLAGIQDYSYPIARPLQFYVKKAHVGVVPGIEEFLQAFTSPDAMGEDGYLTDIGLVALSDGDASDIRSRVANLETLDLD